MESFTPKKWANTTVEGPSHPKTIYEQTTSKIMQMANNRATPGKHVCQALEPIFFTGILNHLAKLSVSLRHLLSTFFSLKKAVFDALKLVLIFPKLGRPNSKLGTHLRTFSWLYAHTVWPDQLREETLFNCPQFLSYTFTEAQMRWLLFQNSLHGCWQGRKILDVRVARYTSVGTNKTKIGV